MVGDLPFGCGVCLPCRINRRRLWTLRLMLERMKHADACYLTLTYNDYFLPKGAELYPRDITLFLKRLRKRTGHNLKYFYCGEYGPKDARPHYHMILFGIGPEYHEVMLEEWGKGFIKVGDVTGKSISYVAGYTLKKYCDDSVQHEEIRKKKVKEFHRMSRRPGIGSSAVKDLALSMEKHVADFITVNGDIPGQIRIFGKKYPWGKYLRKKLIEELGYDEEKFKKERMEKFKKEVNEKYGVLAEACKEKGLSRSERIKRAIVEFNNQAALNQKSRMRVYERRERK